MEESFLHSDQFSDASEHPIPWKRRHACTVLMNLLSAKFSKLSQQDVADLFQDAIKVYFFLAAVGGYHGLLKNETYGYYLFSGPIWNFVDCFAVMPSYVDANNVERLPFSVRMIASANIGVSGPVMGGITAWALACTMLNQFQVPENVSDRNGVAVTASMFAFSAAMLMGFLQSSMMSYESYYHMLSVKSQQKTMGTIFEKARQSTMYHSAFIDALAWLFATAGSFLAAYSTIQLALTPDRDKLNNLLTTFANVTFYVAAYIKLAQLLFRYLGYEPIAHTSRWEWWWVKKLYRYADDEAAINDLSSKFGSEVYTDVAENESGTDDGSGEAPIKLGEGVSETTKALLQAKAMYASSRSVFWLACCCDTAEPAESAKLASVI